MRNSFYDSDRNNGDISVRVLLRLRNLVKDLKGGASPQEILKIMASGDFPQCTLTSVVTVGVALLACMPKDASDPDWWETPASSMRTKIEAVADARAAMSGPAALRADAIALAVDLASPEEPLA